MSNRAGGHRLAGALLEPLRAGTHSAGSAPVRPLPRGVRRQSPGSTMSGPVRQRGPSVAGRRRDRVPGRRPAPPVFRPRAEHAVRRRGPAPCKREKDIIDDWRAN